MSSQIEVRISPTGELQIHVQGVKGQKCTDVTAALEAAVGAIINMTPTEEMFQPDDQETMGTEIWANS